MDLVETEEEEISSATLDRIEQLWNSEREELGETLFDGKIFSAKEVSSSVLKGRFVSYKHFVACQRDPEIAEELGIEAVAVTGMTSLEGSADILIGRRSRTCIQDRSCYELLPSGGVDDKCCLGNKVLYKEQFFCELEEETGLGRDLVHSLKPDLLVFDKERRVWELCLQVTVDKEAKSLLSKRLCEHQEVLWLPRCDVLPFLKMNQGRIVSLTELLLDGNPKATSRLGVL